VVVLGFFLVSHAVLHINFGALAPHLANASFDLMYSSIPSRLEVKGGFTFPSLSPLFDVCHRGTGVFIGWLYIVVKSF